MYFRDYYFSSLLISFCIVGKNFSSFFCTLIFNENVFVFDQKRERERNEKMRNF